MAIELPPLEIDSVHLGQWLPFKAVVDLIPEMSAHYQRRLKAYHNGTSDDLSQAAHLALLEWKAENGEVERIREMVGIGLLHRAMVSEVRQNRKQSAGSGGLEWAVEMGQLTEKQIETVSLFAMNAAKAARKPYFEIVWLRKALGWSAQAVSDYFRRKRDDRHFWSPESIDKMAKKGAERIRRKVAPDIVMDVRYLQLLK